MPPSSVFIGLIKKTELLHDIKDHKQFEIFITRFLNTLNYITDIEEFCKLYSHLYIVLDDIHKKSFNMEIVETCSKMLKEISYDTFVKKFDEDDDEPEK